MKPKPILRVLRGECRYPVAEPSPRQHRFCAEQARPGSSYCDHHHAIARRAAGDEKQLQALAEAVR